MGKLFTGETKKVICLSYLSGNVRAVSGETWLEPLSVLAIGVLLKALADAHNECPLWVKSGRSPMRDIRVSQSRNKLLECIGRDFLG